MRRSHDAAHVVIDAPTAPSRLTSDVSTDGDQTVLRLVGDMDLAGVPDLQTLVTAVVARRDMRRFVIDLAGVDFIDPTGIGALVQARTTCADRQASLTLRAVGPQVHRVLTIAGLAGVFELGDDTSGRR